MGKNKKDTDKKEIIKKEISKKETSKKEQSKKETSDKKTNKKAVDKKGKSQKEICKKKIKKDTGKNKPDKKATENGMEFDSVLKEIKKVQDSKRFIHTLGVSYTAASLAMRYEVSVKDAQMAGLLHDVAKCMSDEKLLSFCNKNNLPVSKAEEKAPYLLHAKVGAFIAETEYGITDEDILNAIRYHTTGRPEMSMLEKIIFVADYMEPGRKQASNLDEIRHMAFTDLDQTVIRILGDTLKYLEKSGKNTDPMTQETYSYYVAESSGSPEDKPQKRK